MAPPINKGSVWVMNAYDIDWENRTFIKKQVGEQGDVYLAEDVDRLWAYFKERMRFSNQAMSDKNAHLVKLESMLNKMGVMK